MPKGFLVHFYIVLHMVNAPSKSLHKWKKLKITEKSSGVTLFRYNDNGIVTLASTCEGVTQRTALFMQWKERDVYLTNNLCPDV